MTPTTASIVPLAKRWAAGDRAAGSELVRVHDDWILMHARKARFEEESLDDVAQVMRLGFLYQCKQPMAELSNAIICSALKRRMRQWLRNERDSVRWASLVWDAPCRDDEAKAWKAAVEAREYILGIFNDRLVRYRRDLTIDAARLIGTSGLSERETEVVVGLLRDDTFRDIAESMGVGVGSVSYLYDCALKKMASASKRGAWAKREEAA